ncbi:dihydrofolate reductase family protein [Arthrobacter sp. NPDC057013]|uniref:dihydrofolate reductase family protein n=1 Tax=Arthrobacter sp. NPDC057013 TaxID=3345999 RepID=UPI00362CC791
MGRSRRSLLPLGLVDELFQMIHPLVLGSGRRLFGPDHDPRRLRLVDAATTWTGALMVTYLSA